MERLTIRPSLGESRLDGALVGAGWLWLTMLGMVSLIFFGSPKAGTDGAVLPAILLFLLPAIFTGAAVVNYFAQIEIDGDLLRFYGPGIKEQKINISDIKRVNVVLISLPRGGHNTSLEIVTSSQRVKIPLWFRSQDISLVLRYIKTEVPSAIFDERADLLEQNRPLPD